jgi:hypothetical protein
MPAKMGERGVDAMGWPNTVLFGTKPLILTKQYQTVKAE